jgi:hemerythrin-like domain-containing protein
MVRLLFAMRIKKALQPDIELISRFTAVLGGGLNVAAHSRTAKPDFFIHAGQFIQAYIQAVYFKKEDVLLEALQDWGFPADQGPVGSMRSGQTKSGEIARMLVGAASHWQHGGEEGRGDTVWATSEFTGLMRSHFELLNTLIYPLVDQSISPEDEQGIAAKINHLNFGEPPSALREKYLKFVENLEEEFSDWR